ncbi:hypothetical protein COCC4DRAFT_30451 [Bipolaris maydis ATCC 48331]|uniref:Uncharacterized protein n=2 Tax=Cochliobolus heterostrophus TaxID=5016 RepID=M2UUJ5_COCH5|nr:uncharacterized protein COCC4DRAFT_30451 [Bipolaris maydis ATCC 48331]EMD91533.1 hypothetical protein COCHEDRAFT_1021488 [Bipolaris maydis C5]ENI08709.1 hypothetical protein COCC4DRAFT_30451 [Bipolaris maydis ATCC 48331]
MPLFPTPHYQISQDISSTHTSHPRLKRTKALSLHHSSLESGHTLAQHTHEAHVFAHLDLSIRWTCV